MSSSHTHDTRTTAEICEAVEEYEGLGCTCPLPLDNEIAPCVFCAIRSLIQRAGELEDGLRKHGDHTVGCATNAPPELCGRCTCGLDVLTKGRR